MYVRPRPRFRPRNAGGVAFSPAFLFTSGVQGAWYDPSDYSSLFQDSVGTTPVTAVEQPVGLMLDKSQGLVLGSELVTNGNFNGGTTGWTNSSTGTGTFTVTSGAASLSGTDASNRGVMGQGFTTVVGRSYVLTFTASAVSGATLYGASTGAGYSFSLGGGAIPSGSVRFQFVATTTTTYVNFAAAVSSAGAASIDNVSVKDLIGNHATQATSASRPVLRARYNLLTYSEQFDNAAWTKSETTISANSTTAPDGTTSADTATPSTNNLSHRFYQALPAFPANAASVYFKANGYSKVALKDWFSGVYASFDLAAVSVLDKSASVTAGISSEGNGWYRCRMTTTQASTTGIQISLLAPSYTSGDPNGSAFAGDGTSGVFVWGAQYTLRSDSSAGTYQRIAAATDYATAGFLPYLDLITDDSLATGSIDFTATDKMFVCAGLTKNSDAATGTVIDQNGVAATNAFMLRAPSGAATNYVFFSGGSTGFSGATATPYVAPITNVVSGIGNISGDQEIIRINGAQVAISTVDQGTGNYSNLPIYIGRRQGSALPFNGRIYQMVVCGKTLSASELASTEAYVNTKTGAY